MVECIKHFSLRGNFPSSMTSDDIKKCTYHPERNPFCPIFRVGDVLNYTGHEVAGLAAKVFSFIHRSSLQMLELMLTSAHTCGSVPLLPVVFQGGEIGINIEWKCNLDLNIEYCVPKYSFTRLDAPFAKNAVSKGYNFRYLFFFNIPVFFPIVTFLSCPLQTGSPNISSQRMGPNFGHCTKRTQSALTSW